MAGRADFAYSAFVASEMTGAAATGAAVSVFTSAGLSSAFFGARDLVYSNHCFQFVCFELLSIGWHFVFTVGNNLKDFIIGFFLKFRPMSG